MTFHMWNAFLCATARNEYPLSPTNCCRNCALLRCPIAVVALLSEKKKETGRDAGEKHPNRASKRQNSHCLLLCFGAAVSFPAIGSVSLAPNDAARTRLTMRILKDAIREMAKGIAAQSLTSN